MHRMLSRLALIALIAVSLSGCLEYSERIEISRDGSAAIKLQLRIARSLMTLVKTNPAFRSLALMMDPDTLKENLPAEIRLTSHRFLPSPGRQTYVNELFVDDVQGLDTSATSLFKGQTFSVETLPDGKLRYRRTLDFTAAAKDPELAKMMAENRFGIVGILKGAPFEFKLATPLTVLTTNGENDGGTVTWSYSLLELLQNPAELEVVMDAPTGSDKLLGALRKTFRPQYFPIAGVALLGVFFLATRKKSAPAH